MTGQAELVYRCEIDDYLTEPIDVNQLFAVIDKHTTTSVENSFRNCPGFVLLILKRREHGKMYQGI